MAASNLNLGKASGGVLNVQPADGTTNTSIVLPASGTVTTTEYVNSNNLGNGSTTFNGFGGTGFKNYIINGNFDIWQYKNAGLTYPQTSDGYGSDDRWYNANNISTKVHSQVSCTDSERALFNASYFSRTVATYVSGTNSLVKKLQSIENITKLAGKTVTVSFWAKADSSKKMNVQVVDFYGTGGTPTANGTSIVNFGNVDLTSTWTKYKLTATLPSLVGKTLGTDGVHTSRFRLDFGFTFGPDRNEVTSFGMPIGQSGTFDIAQVQLEEGSVATPFENRPYGLELSLCQRYYEHNLFKHYIPNSGASSIITSIPYKVTKRVAASLTYSSVGVNGGYHPPSDNDNVNNENGFNASINGEELNFHWYASAEL